MDTSEEPVGTLSGVVVDRDGVAVAEAVIGVFEEGARHLTGLHHLAACKADANGRFEVAVSAGACLVVPFGPLDFPSFQDMEAVAHGVRVHVGPGGSVADLRLVLPFAMADLGTVTGTVVDGTGAALPGIPVQVDGYSLVEGASIWRTTDESGRIRFTGLHPGQRTLVAMGNRRFHSSRRTVALAPGGAVEETLSMRARERPGTLSVTLRCVDEHGKGLGGVHLTIEGDEDFEESFPTGEDGSVHVAALPDHLESGDAHVSVFHTGFRPASLDIVEPGTGWPAERVLRLRRAVDTESAPARPVRRRGSGTAIPEADAPVSGTVVDRYGIPVEGADVFWVAGKDAEAFNSWSLGTHSVAQTNRGGYFLARGLPPGEAHLLADLDFILERGMLGQPVPRAAVHLEAGKETTGIELRLPFALADIVEVECRVVDDEGRPREGVSVTGDRCIGVLTESEDGRTDGEGRIVLRMFAGRSEVHAWETETHEGVHREVDVASGGRTRVDLVTPCRVGDFSLSLRVIVVDETGEPVEEAKVILSTAEGGVGEGVSDSSGICGFSGLHGGFRSAELHVSAYKAGFFTGTPGATVASWPEEAPAEARVVLWHPIPIRIRVEEEGTGAFVPNCRLEVIGPCNHGCSTYREWDDREGHREVVLPGEVAFRASAPGYEVAEGRAEVGYGEPPATFTLRLKRATEGA